MPTIDLSRLSASDYSEIIERWKSTAKTPWFRGAVNPNHTVTLGAENETLSIEFRFEEDIIETTLHGFDAGHWVQWPIPLDSVPLEPVEAYARLVIVAEEMHEVGFVRRHKRFFTEEWKHFIDLFPL
jgi:hypothetical protein